MLKRIIARYLAIGAALAALFAGGAAFGQANNSNTWQTPGNQTVGGMVQMAPGSSGVAIPIQTNVPPGTAQNAIATGTTGAVTATLPAAAGKTTYICGFDISAAGTATISPITVTGVLGGTLTYQGISAGSAPFSVRFGPCVPASAVNTAINVVTTADGTATAVDVQAYGFQF